MNLKEKTRNFVKDHYNELGLSKRFIKHDEIIEISEENNLDNMELLNLINEANDEFIESQKSVIFKKFFDLLNSYGGFISNDARFKIRFEIFTRDYDYYDEWGMDDYIDEKNNNYLNSLKSQILKKYDSLFKGFIDKNQRENIKNILKKDNCNLTGLNINKFINELNDKYVEDHKIIILQDFNSFLDSCNDIVTNEDYYKLKSKYAKGNFNFFDEFNMHEKIIQKNKSLICKELNQLLSNEEIINDNVKTKLKIKYNLAYYKFFDEMDLESIIYNHNKKSIPQIIENVFDSTDGCISSSKRQELKSMHYGVINWDLYIDSYNDAFINEISSFGNSSFKYKNVNGNIDLKRTRRNVYHVHTYIKPKRRDLPELNKKDVRISKLILPYKHGHDDAVDFFTRDLMKSVVYLSNYVIDDEIKYLALVAIPPSEMEENACSSMRKSINHIKMLYDQQRLPEGFDYSKKICDYGNLLFRFQTVPKSRSGYRVPIERHMETILCTRRNFIRDDMAFILMDDITTQGNIMYACEGILIKNCVKPEKIFKLAIAETEFVYY